jgi:hypothetical protein
VITHSTQVTKVHINILLSFQIFLTSRATFSYFLIFSASALEKLWVMGTNICYKCYFILPIGYCIRSVEVCHSISYDRPVPIITF